MAFWRKWFLPTFQHVEEVESCSRSACERAIQDIVDGELRDEENKKAKDEERRQDEWLENRKKKIKGYSMKDKSHRLTKNTFPGLLSMNDYRHLRIATLGRPTSGKSLTVNRILELFDQKPTEEVMQEVPIFGDHCTHINMYPKMSGYGLNYFD